MMKSKKEKLSINIIVTAFILAILFMILIGLGKFGFCEGEEGYYDKYCTELGIEDHYYMCETIQYDSINMIKLICYVNNGRMCHRPDLFPFEPIYCIGDNLTDAIEMCDSINKSLNIYVKMGE